MNNKLRIAILYSDNRVYVEFSSTKFKKLFEKYFKKYKNINKTFKQIENDLKKETLYL